MNVMEQKPQSGSLRDWNGLTSTIQSNGTTGIAPVPVVPFNFTVQRAERPGTGRMASLTGVGTV